MSDWEAKQTRTITVTIPMPDGSIAAPDSLVLMYASAAISGAAQKALVAAMDQQQ